MRKKRGFVFVETIVVSAILTISLLMIYSSYTAIVIQENVRLKYDDPVYIYRTFHLQNFLKDTRLDLISKNLIDNYVMDNFSCDSSGLFNGVYDNKGFCEALIIDYHVNNMYFTFNDLTFIQECNSSTGKCEVLNQVRSDMVKYLKTIGGSGKNGYRLIVEFSENKDGSFCEGEKESCIYYYASISLGDL